MMITFMEYTSLCVIFFHDLSNLVLLFLSHNILCQIYTIPDVVFAIYKSTERIRNDGSSILLCIF